jgi:hypothetical protein
MTVVSQSARNRLAMAVTTMERLESRQLFAIPAGLNGSGVPVAQVEADFATNQFEVNPAAVNQPASLFTYTSPAGTATGTPPPNAAGTESGHADVVGQIFYGKGTSYAPSVSHVDNYEVNYFINNIIEATNPPNIAAKVINQSFIATDDTGAPIEDPVLDQAYDNYIARYNKIIVSSAGNSGSPSSPSTAYNDISVGSSDGATAIGPTADGRSKPDVTAPGGETSFTAPQVAGAAAVLVQAGRTGYGGWNTLAATDERLIKALLLNGADKPAGWTHTPTQPLDPHYGAGVLDLSNSLAEMEGGQDWLAIPTISPLGGAHAPISIPFLSSTHLNGWDLNTIATGKFDTINNYLFNVRGASGTSDTLTATLTWNRQANQAAINNLDLYLYNTNTHALVSASISSVDNVEEIYAAGLAPGHYDLEVLKHGGTPGATAGDVSNSETYALAFNFAGPASPARTHAPTSTPPIVKSTTSRPAIESSRLFLPAISVVGSASTASATSLPAVSASSSALPSDSSALNAVASATGQTWSDDLLAELMGH